MQASRFVRSCLAVVGLALLLVAQAAHARPIHQFRQCRVGQCFDVHQRMCTSQLCGRGLPPCAPHSACDRLGRRCACQPPPTPTPPPSQCSSVPCGGSCAICPPCTPGSICPKAPCRLGTCEVDAAASGCACVAGVATPTPTPTPTSQCSTAPCGGGCLIRPPCTPGTLCPNYVLLGECQADAAGACQCVPAQQPTPTATPTPPTCASDADCNDGNGCTVDHCVGGVCEHACICLTASGAPACCPGPAALCVRPCGADAAGTCGGVCPAGASCAALPTAATACGCVSGAGGPCDGNLFAPPPVCAPGLVCQQSLPDATGVCVVPKCIALFTSGCAQTSDCCEPCGNGRRPPCGVCIQGACIGAP